MITESMYANFIEQLKILNNNISKQNEILSSQNDMLGAFLIQATSESKFVKMTPNEIDMLIEVSDPDGVWIMLQDMGEYDAAEYVEEKYFNF